MVPISSLYLLLLLAMVIFPATKSSVLDPRIHQELQADSTSQLVLFYSPSCPKCNAFLATYAQIIDDFEKTSDSGIHSINFSLTHSLILLIGKYNFVAIDAIQNIPYTASFDVENVPQLFLLHNGRVFRYKNAYKYTEVVEFINDVYSGSGNVHALAWYESPIGIFGKSKKSIIKVSILLMSYMNIPQYMGFWLTCFCTAFIILSITLCGVYISVSTTHHKEHMD